MVYNEKAYRSIFPKEVPAAKPVHRESMIEDDEPEVDIKNDSEDELTVEAPDPVQEGGVDESGTDDTAD